MREALNESLLLRLSHEAMIGMYGSGPGFTARAVHGTAMVLSGEPVADLNYLIANGATPGAVAAFSSFVEYADARSLPFCAMIAAGVGVFDEGRKSGYRFG